MTTGPGLWAIVPAAGVGRRMGSPVPKQFLKLGNKTVLEHSLDALWSLTGLTGMVLVSDGHPSLAAVQERCSDRLLLRAPGGKQRCHSVLNGLAALADSASAQDWVLVHDAARPCVQPADIDRLIDTCMRNTDGGLLGMPVSDTMKRVDTKGNVTATVDRTGLWHALTPQMFRAGQLLEALRQGIRAGKTLTDEASAMEAAGYAPRMVEGQRDNIKITVASDLELAGYYLQRQHA